MSAKPVFRSSGKPGFSSAVRDAPARVMARKLAREVDVRFAEQGCTVRTAEGEVRARPGDAILTGTSGEHWRVSSAHFPGKYEPVPPTAPGGPGRYRAKRYEVMALRMSQSFRVVLSDGLSDLDGRAGDWLVDYGDGSLGIVSPRIFDTTYEIMS
ncbi:MAG TPA: PGDYG domain-containing protein [Steroidobacteraceae bacterium]|nr:PGDYG domain-containing protein [Steroidobacteraceae bacterium]